jgi:hypothetical protein
MEAPTLGVILQPFWLTGTPAPVWRRRFGMWLLGRFGRPVVTSLVQITLVVQNYITGNGREGNLWPLNKG